MDSEAVSIMSYLAIYFSAAFNYESIYLALVVDYEYVCVQKVYVAAQIVRYWNTT